MSEAMMWRSRWTAKVTQSFADPHYARVPRDGGLKPHLVNTSIVGEHISVIFNPAVDHVRFYAFEGQANRDRFVNLYRQHGAQPCGDPLKVKSNAKADT